MEKQKRIKIEWIYSLKKFKAFIIGIFPELGTPS